MNKIKQLLKVLSVVIYFFSIIFLFYKNKQLVEIYNLPTWIIPSLFLINIFYVFYKYIISIIKKNKNEVEIFSIINHTFRTPLTSIIWYSKELEKNIPSNEKLLYLQNINNSASKIINIVDILIGIKDIKDRSSYSFEATSIREIIETSIKKYRDAINKKNINFQFSLPNNVPLLTVDLKKISFVIDTVLENAINYTQKDGKILIDCIYNNSRLILYISDTGIGLNFINKIKIFSKFYRGHQAKLMNTDGLGLKLYLSRQIIKRHGGKIYAKSNGLNEGATFFIELPFQK